MYANFTDIAAAYKWEFSARKRALNEELRMMNEEFFRFVTLSKAL